MCAHLIVWLSENSNSLMIVKYRVISLVWCNKNFNIQEYLIGDMKIKSKNKNLLNGKDLGKRVEWIAFQNQIDRVFDLFPNFRQTFHSFLTNLARNWVNLDILFSKLVKVNCKKGFSAWKCTLCFWPETVFCNRLIFRLFRKYGILYIETWIWGFDEYSVLGLSWGKMKWINLLVLSLSLNPHRIRKYSKFHSEDDLDCINRNLSESFLSEEMKWMPSF